MRRLLEQAASDQPLVMVVDDVHWAEPTLLDLLEYLVAFSSGHPILLVCLTRAELLDARPAWTTPQANQSLLQLEPLLEPEARQLVENAAPGELGTHAAARIVETAEGNPLFLEQLVAVKAEGGEAALPSTIQSVLAARIDHLEPGERSLLEHASVQGRSFYVGAVEASLPERDRPGTAKRLVSLVHRQLVRAERSELPGQDAFRFTHVLIRDAVYQGMPKAQRAELHEHLAAWLEASPGAQDETIGHHLAEAHRQLAELGHTGEHESALASAGAQRLANAADAALLRGDARAGARLLDRAQSLLAPDADVRVALLPQLGAALLEAGELDRAERVLSEAVEHAGADQQLRSRALVERQLVCLQAGTGGSPDEVAQIVDSALRELQGDERGKCRALCLKALQAFVEGRAAAADEAWQRAAEHARRAGDEAALFEILGWRASEALFGPTPVPAAIARCRQICDQVQGSPVALARTFRPTAALHAMAGDFDEADRLIRAADKILGELGGLESAVAQQEAMVDMLAGRPEAAEARLRTGYEKLEEMGEKALLADTAAMLGRALYVQDRHEEASEFCQVSKEAAADEDLSARVSWRGLRARLVADHGSREEAEAHATEAVRLAERTDFLTLHAEALVDLSEVLVRGKRSSEADAARQTALELYRRKGDLVSLERARSGSM